MVDVPAWFVAFHLGYSSTVPHDLEFTMPVPVLDRFAHADGLIGPLAAFSQMSDASFALLVELVPERGEALWIRFRTWERAQSNRNVGFNEWLAALVRENTATVLYPIGCTLDVSVRTVLASEVFRAAGARGDSELLNAHFAIEPQYSRVRAVSCRGCPVTKCVHYL